MPAPMVQEMVALFEAGQWGQLELKARAAVKRYPGQSFGWRALAKSLLKSGQADQALHALARITSLAPGDADAFNDQGSILTTLGRKGEAEASFRRAVQLEPGFAAAHNNLGRLLAGQFRLDDAMASLRLSLAIDPLAAGTHNCLGNVLDGLGRRKEAEASYRRALELDPGHFEAWVNLAFTLRELNRWDEAEASCRRALAIQPDSDFALNRLGSLLDLFRTRDGEAIACLERAVALNPANVDARHTLGNVLLRTGQVEAAMAQFRSAQALRPLTTWRARREKPAFSVLFLDSPGPGSTPVTYLAGRASYDSHFYCVLADGQPDFTLLRARADVVVNMIADADNGAEILPFVQQIVDALARPTVNPPSRVTGTGRETVAGRLAGIPLCRIPRTLRMAGPELKAAVADQRMDGFPLPMLVRLAGTHGGDDFEKLDDLGAVLDFIARWPEATYYLIEFVDYRSADGWFRKYRFIYIDGAILPYHLAIHDDWKVHHFRTDMAHQEWMRREEEHFLENPLQVFDPARQDALRAVAAATGLNYGGIDCALDREGGLVVFETNAAMLVHDEKDELFAYKNPYIARIKEAFDRMLGRLAGEASRRE